MCFEMINGLRCVRCITTYQESVHECVTTQEDKKELKASFKKEFKTTKLLIIMSRTEYVENDVRRFLKGRAHFRIHETRLLCSQSMHDLPQSPEYCSPTKQARDAQPTHRDVVKCCAARPSHTPHVSFILIRSSPDFDVMLLNQIPAILT